MALNKQKQELLEVLVAKGDMSDRAIAREVKCDPKTVRNYIDKLDLEKSSLSSLAKEDIANTIKGNEIDTKKSSLNPHQRKAYDEVYITMSQSLNLFNNATIDNQLLTNQAQEHIKQCVADNPETILDHLPNLMATGKMTETNRKQILGITESHKQKEEQQDHETIITYINDIKERE